MYYSQWKVSLEYWIFKISLLL